MKNLHTYEEFVNESTSLNESSVYATLKTVKLKMPTIRELSNMWDNGKRSVVNNLVKKVQETRRKIEENYNKEQSTYDRPGKISDMSYDLVQLSAYIRDITSKLQDIKI